MTPEQKRLHDIETRQSRARARLSELGGTTEWTDDLRAEFDALESSVPDLEREYRAAKLAVQTAEAGSTQTRTTGEDPEKREEAELRSRASLTGFILAAAKGRAVTGAEAELVQHLGVEGIPLCMFDAPETRAATPAPATGGVNFDPILPAVFAPSIAAELGIDMPTVESGTYATGTLTTPLTAGAAEKGAQVPQTAGAITAQTATPKRVGGSLAIAVEDVAAIGAANFEAILRENVSLVLSDELDRQILTGDGTGGDLNGIFEALADPSAPSAVADWAAFVQAQAQGIDGLWATELSQVVIMAGVETYRLAASTFQGADAEESAAAYLKRMGAGFMANARMPDPAADVQPAILCRKGKPGMRTAVSPVWNGAISIDDIYSGARKGERFFTLSALVGDVIVTQPGAYSQIAFQVA